MSEGLGQLGEGMSEGSEVSDEELLKGLAGEMEGIMKSLRAGKYMASEGGKAASDWGIGSTNLKVDSAPGTDEGDKGERDVPDAGNERSEIDFTPSYAPEQIPKDSYDTRVRGSIGDAGATLTQEFKSLPSDARGLSEYYNIVNAYTGSQERALEDEDIPAEFRDLVRQYFSGLNDPKDGILPSMEPSTSGTDETESDATPPVNEDGTRLEVLTDGETDTT